MKKTLFQTKNALVMVLAMSVGIFFTACEKDKEEETVEDATAIFSYTAEGTTVTFVNASANATSYTWDFGDGNSSTEENPVHTYADAGAYMVTLGAINSAGTHELIVEVMTQNSGAIASKLVGKAWIAAHGPVWCYALGPQNSGDFIVGETWFDQSPPWWGYGDADGQTGGWAQLADRPSLYNDEYTFSVDGKMTVDFKGDFWGEYGLWSDTDYNEVDIQIGAGLPDNAAGESMAAFASGDWEFIVDEEAKTLTVKGDGAHILNPRVGGGGAQITTPVAEVTYDVIRISEGGECDTLVILGKANDGTNDIAQYTTLHHYPNPNDKPEVLDKSCFIERSGTTPAATFAHTFASEDGATGMATMNPDYTFTYGVDMGGETATKVDIQNDGAPYGNIMMRGGTTGICEDGTESYVEAITFDSDEYVVKFDIYIPTDGNDFDGTALTNIVSVRWVDESQYNQFWEHYLYIDQTDLALDTWLAMEYDFSTNAEAIYSNDGSNYSLEELITAGKNVPDAIHIDFGGDNHTAAGTFYIKNFRLEAAP